MTRNVQSEELLINFAEIQVGDDQLFAVIYRFDNIACVGRDNRAASAPIKPRFLTPLARAFLL